MKCRNCQSMLVDALIFCARCGSIANRESAEPILCETHPEERAAGLCVVCFKPVCGDCAVTLEGRTFCDVPLHRQLHSDWRPVYSAPSEFQADMVQKNLAGVGIESKTFSARDHCSLHWHESQDFVRVLARSSDSAKALETLRDLELVDNADSTSTF